MRRTKKLGDVCVGALVAGQVNAQGRSAVHVIIVGARQFHRGAVGGENLHVQAEGLQLLEEDLEGLRNTRIGMLSPLTMAS